jgi:hypothetical protein
MKCSHCAVPGASQQCSGCRTVTYCGAECQRAAWSGHKKTCKAIKRAKAEAIASLAASGTVQPDGDAHPFAAASEAARESLVASAYAGCREAPAVLPMTWRVLPDDDGALGNAMICDRVRGARVASGDRKALAAKLLEALLILVGGFHASSLARLRAAQQKRGRGSTSVKGCVVLELSGCRIEELMVKQKAQPGQQEQAVPAEAGIAMLFVQYPDIERYMRARWAEHDSGFEGSPELQSMVDGLFVSLGGCPEGNTSALVVYRHQEDAQGFSMTIMHAPAAPQGATPIVDKLAVMAGLEAPPHALQVTPRTGELTFYDMDPANHVAVAIPGPGMSEKEARENAKSLGFGLGRGGGGAGAPADDRAIGVLQSNEALMAAITALLGGKHKLLILGFAAACYKRFGKGALFIMSRSGIDDVTATNPRWNFDWSPEESAASVLNAPNCSRHLDRQVAMAWGRLRGGDDEHCLSMATLSSKMKAFTTTLAPHVKKGNGDKTFMVVLCADPEGASLPDMLRSNFRVPPRALVPEPAPCSISVVGPVTWGPGKPGEDVDLLAKVGQAYFPGGQSAVFSNYDRGDGDPETYM